MNGRHGFAGVMAIVGLSIAAEAHLQAGSLTIKGNEKFKVGEKVSVKWTVENTHAPGKFDLNLSTNGGTSFELIETKTFPLSPGEYTYEWMVPNNPSTTAQLQVCQYDGIARCSGVYTLKSNNFTIETGTSIPPKKVISSVSSFTFDPDSKSLEFSFKIVREETVKILVLDAQGKEVASLLDGKLSPGLHKKSFYSNALNAYKTLLIQIRIGSEVFSEELHPYR
jgi:hypothetical protein